MLLLLQRWCRMVPTTISQNVCKSFTMYGVRSTVSDDGSLNRSIPKSFQHTSKKDGHPTQWQAMLTLRKSPPREHPYETVSPSLPGGVSPSHLTTQATRQFRQAMPNVLTDLWAFPSCQQLQDSEWNIVPRL